MIAKKNFHRKTAVLAIAAIFGVILVLTTALFAIGFISLVFKQPSQNVVVVDTVCDDDIVNNYNNAQKLQKRGDTEDYTADLQTLNKMMSDIQAKNNYNNDPTCQAIIMAIAVTNNNYDLSNQSYTSLQKMQSAGRFYNNNLRITSLEQYKIFIDDINPQKSTDQTTELQGGS